MTVDRLISFLIVLGIALVLYLIWVIIWRALYTPIRMKDEVLKEREEAKKDLLEIQAAKSVEWDKYKELEEELDKQRKIFYQEKSKKDELLEEVAKLKVDKENLVAYNKKLKEENKK